MDLQEPAGCPEVLKGFRLGTRRNGVQVMMVRRQTPSGSWTWNTLGLDGPSCSVTAEGLAGRMYLSELDIVTPGATPPETEG